MVTPCTIRFDVALLSHALATTEYRTRAAFKISVAPIETAYSARSEHSPKIHIFLHSASNSRPSSSAIFLFYPLMTGFHRKMYYFSTNKSYPYRLQQSLCTYGGQKAWGTISIYRMGLEPRVCWSPNIGYRAPVLCLMCCGLSRPCFFLSEPVPHCLEDATIAQHSVVFFDDVTYFGFVNFRVQLLLHHEQISMGVIAFFF